MSISTFAELKTALANWSKRTDLTAVLADFIALAEARINRDLRSMGMLKSVTASMTATSRAVALPTDFMELRSIAVYLGSDRKQPEFVTPEVLNDNTGGGSGFPCRYTIIGNNLRFDPAPDQAYTVGIDYYAKLDALSDGNPTNWLLALAPDVYLHGAMTELGAYIYDIQQSSMSDTRYQAALQSLKRSSRNAQFSGSDLRVTPK